MAVEVASAYVTLMPSMKGFQSRMEKEFRGAQIGASADRQGESIGKRLTSSIGSSMAKWAKRGAVATGAAVVGFLGTAVYKGFQRLKGIENAEAMMKGLGFDPKQIKGISEQAMNAVLGTVYGFDEAMTVAATATAAGVTDIEGYLGTIADVATLTQRDLDDVGGIFNKIMSRGRITLEEINQMPQLPLRELIANFYGVHVEAAEKMITDGQVSADDFLKIMEKYEGAADAAGDTTTGAFALMNAALARFGVALIEDFYPLLGPIFNGLTSMLDNLTATMGPVMEKIATALIGFFTNVYDRAGAVFDFVREGVEGLVKVFTRQGTGQLAAWLGVDQGHFIIDWLQRIRDFVTIDIPAGFEFLGGVIEGVFNIFTMQGTGLLAKTLGVSQDHWIIKHIQDIRQAFSNLFSYITETAIPGFQNFLDEFRTGEGLGGRVRTAIERLSDAVGIFITAVKDTVLPILSDLWTMFVDNVLPILFDVWEFIVGTLAPDIATMFRDHIGPAVTSFWNEDAKPALEALWKFIKDILWPFIEDFYENGIKPTFQFIGEFIESTWQDMIRPVLHFLIDALDDVQGAFDSAKRGIERAWDAIKGIVARPIVAVVEFVNTGIIGTLNKVLEWAGIDTIDPINLPASIKNAAKGYGANTYSGSAGRSNSPWMNNELATGGVLPGYSPGYDDLLFQSTEGYRLALSGGEAIMRPEWTKAVGPNFVSAMNAAARSGGVAGVKQAMGFANGGVFGQQTGDGQGLWDTLKGWGGKVIGGLTDFFSDPLGFIKRAFDGVMDWLSGDNPLFGVGSKLLSDLISAAPGKIKELAFGNTGVNEDWANFAGAGGLPWQAIWGIVKSLFPDAIKTSDVRNSTVAGYGGKSLHASGRAIDFVLNPWSRMVDATKVLSSLMGWTELIHTPAGRWQQSFGKSFTDFLPITKSQHYDHVHAAMKDGGIMPGLYDDGGWLQPGVSLVANKTGKPEAVFTDEQLNRLGGNTHVTINGVPMDSAGQTADEILYQLRRVDRGKYAARR